MTIREIQLEEAARKALAGNVKDLESYLQVRRDWRPTLLTIIAPKRPKRNYVYN